MARLTVNIAFSRDGRALRELQRVDSSGKDTFSGVRAITYVTATGTIRRVQNLAANTMFFSATTDGRNAIVSVQTGPAEDQQHPFLVDTETGKMEGIPQGWLNSGPYPFVAISGDGRLISIYSESRSEEEPLLVSVYSWRTKRLFARQTSGYIAASGMFGGLVTEDGMIEFWNNRFGGEILDPKTGRLLVRVGAHSYRSVDGAWIVELPNPILDNEPREAIIRSGRSGQTIGKLDLHIPDGEQGARWDWARGAFCGRRGMFVTGTYDTVQAFEIPSGKKIADFPVHAWRDPSVAKGDHTVVVACSSDGKRVAIRSGNRLTLHNLR